MFALSRFISFFTVTQCMSGTSVWTLENVASFSLNKFSLCCFDESSVDVVDICFYALSSTLSAQYVRSMKESVRRVGAWGPTLPLGGRRPAAG